MKWFRHDSDSHTNAKMRLILRENSAEGYGICWICRELVAKDGINFRIKAEKEWKNTLKDVTGLSVEKIDSILAYQGKIKAICPNALKKGDLYIPKMKEKADDYAKRVRRLSEQTSDKVPLHNNTLQDITKQHSSTPGVPKAFELWDELYKTATGEKYLFSGARNGKNFKILIDAYTWPKVHDLMKLFFKLAEEDPFCWWKDKLEVGVFFSQVTKLITKITKGV